MSEPIHPPALIEPTGKPGVDRVIRAIVGTFEEAFPGRVRGYYLVGSQADDSAVALSDVDVRVVFKGSFEGEEELQRFLRVRENLRQTSPLEIDCPPLDEERLRHDDDWLHETLSIKNASRFLYGNDIRGELPDPSLDAYLVNTARALRMFVSRLHRQDTYSLPLQYPNPSGEFYGYDMPGSIQVLPSLKMLVHVAGFLATWKVACEARQMVVRKNDWLPQYQEWIHDPWTSLLQGLWNRCKVAWSYYLPEAAADRIWLRQACERFLLFENDTLSRGPDPFNLV